jgi:hypothetical protein
MDISQEANEEIRMNIKMLVVIRNKLLEKHGGKEAKYLELKLKTYDLAAFG